MKPALLFVLALLCGVAVEAATHDSWGRPTPEFYKAHYMPHVWGDTLLPRILAQRPDLWKNVRGKQDSTGYDYVTWLDDSGAEICRLSFVKLVGGSGSGYLEIRRSRVQGAAAAVMDPHAGAVIARIRKGSGVFSVEAGESVHRAECPSIPARVAVVTLP
mgnify:CR=1 FL=1